MGKEHPLPPELQNNLKFSDVINDTLAPDEDKEQSIVDETLSGLGGEWVIGNIIIPPPTAGVVMLLEAIDSPFTTGGSDEVTLDDIFRALYIIVNRENAVTPIMLERSDKKARDAFDKTEKTPEHLSVYLNYLDRKDIDAFDADVKAWSLNAGIVIPAEAAAVIGKFISLSMGGFETLPNKESGKKKT